MAGAHVGGWSTRDTCLVVVACATLFSAWHARDTISVEPIPADVALGAIVGQLQACVFQCLTGVTHIVFCQEHAIST